MLRSTSISTYVCELKRNGYRYVPPVFCASRLLNRNIIHRTRYEVHRHNTSHNCSARQNLVLANIAKYAQHSKTPHKKIFVRDKYEYWVKENAEREIRFKFIPHQYPLVRGLLFLFASLRDSVKNSNLGAVRGIATSNPGKIYPTLISFSAGGVAFNLGRMFKG